PQITPQTTPAPDAGQAAPRPPSAITTAGPTGNALNPRALDNIRALGNGAAPSLLRRVVQAYLDETPKQLACLRTALRDQQHDTLRRIAHSLKSSCANIGAEALATLSKDLEQLGQAHTTDGAPALLAGMEREFETVRRALRTVLEKEP
ncbi:MAG: Hpt domain-containing protein, partial [Burkholderiaceae bacterium]|nr:Hpt domain-containing protein [Burkholderiaceae bacterium]